MITVPEALWEIVRKSPFLEEALSKELINISSLAREVKPRLEKKLYKKVSNSAIIMALIRLSHKLRGQENNLRQVLAKITDLTVRSNIVEFTFDNSPTLFENQRKLLEKLADEQKVFFTVGHGVFETSVFINQSNSYLVEDIFKKEKLRNQMNTLSAITIILPTEATHIPGVYYSILKALAWEGINFIEIVSSYTELTIIVENSVVNEAFSILKNLV